MREFIKSIAKKTWKTMLTGCDPPIADVMLVRKFNEKSIKHTKGT